MTQHEPSEPRQNRRSFLKYAGLGAAGVTVAGAGAFGISSVLGSRPDTTPAPTPTTSVPPRADGAGFDHLVVIMFENRSFDNVLGYLYADGAPAGAHFEGLTDAHGNSAHDGTFVAAHRYSGPTDTIMSSPRPDPGEEYPHVNTQLFGTVDPAHNAHRKVAEMTSPFNAPAAGATPKMDGFVRDYIDTYTADHGGKEPTKDEYSVIMGAFDPDMLPVMSTLAREFAVYDSWHAAVPSQTFCNRSFFHASTSHGYVTNGGDGGYRKWLRPDNATPTIFNRLEDAGLDWAIYFDDRSLISMTGLIHAPSLEKFFATDHFRPMTRFFDDVADGRLPAYAFVEPRMVYDHNDMHPPVGPMTETDVDGTVIAGGAISDVRAGEALLHKVYSAVRASGSTSGSNAMNTMLLVTFDEHGGTYDHVPPGPATPPPAVRDPEMGFSFDRLGLRVPAIAISAYTAKNTIVHDPMHHGSVISTLTAAHGLEPLNARDASAPTLANAVNLTDPRDPRDWPQTNPQYVPKNPESDAAFHPGEEDRPLSPPGVGLVGMLLAKYGPEGVPVPKTYREAYDAIHTYGKGIFGTPA